MEEQLQASNLIVSYHAVERYRERSGDNKSDLGTVTKQIKTLVSTYPVVQGRDNTKYVRVTGLNLEPIWFVVRGRVVRTTLTHNQYLQNIEVGRAT
jgi:hypothetical protein